jgi:hypothetical protein
VRIDSRTTEAAIVGATAGTVRASDTRGRRGLGTCLAIRAASRSGRGWDRGALGASRFRPTRCDGALLDLGI